jgi:hypothetical protein
MSVSGPLMLYAETARLTHATSLCESCVNKGLRRFFVSDAVGEKRRKIRGFCGFLTVSVWPTSANSTSSVSLGAKASSWNFSVPRSSLYEVTRARIPAATARASAYSTSAPFDFDEVESIETNCASVSSTPISPSRSEASNALVICAHASF